VAREGGKASVCRTDVETQRLVNSHFERASAFWTDVYEREDVIALICQRRRDIALGWLDELELPVHGRVLEVGCGAGLTSVELATRGFDVDATDTVPDMIELTRRHAAQANVSARLRTTLNDVHALEFEDQTFDAVIALGVLPWLHSPQTAVHELARVLKPRAHLVVSANNADRLPYLIDPKYNRALSPVRKAVKRLLGRVGLRGRRKGDRQGGGARGPVVHMVTPKEFDRMLGAAGLSVVRGETFGFGPFTFLGRQVLPQRLGVELHRRLEGRAERGGRVLRQRGHQYIVLARKGTGVDGPATHD
jgi:2-polyprenyl-3-methyl-5-hydroxy-6-metoxy-1,4-benzoquinol methylase